MLFEFTVNMLIPITSDIQPSAVGDNHGVGERSVLCRFPEEEC